MIQRVKTYLLIISYPHTTPQRPDDLEDICLHDFIANYSWHETDHNGDRKLSKPRLVNHKTGKQRRLLLLSDSSLCTLQREGALLRENETAEEAFNRLLPNSDDCSNYHRKLQTMLNAEAKVRKINEARRQKSVRTKKTKSKITYRT